jgi:hypothetical protein
VPCSASPLHPERRADDLRGDGVETFVCARGVRRRVRVRARRSSARSSARAAFVGALGTRAASIGALP